MPLVSAVITTYNRAEYLKRALKSVVAQTYKNMEIIIVDDCSTDETQKVLSELKKENSKIIIIRNKANLGQTKSANRGIRTAKGKYIARLDDDDFWCDAKKLEKQVDFLEENPEYGLVGGGLIKIDENGKEFVRLLPPEKDEDIRNVILVNNVFAHSTVVFRKDIFKRVGGYDEQFIFGEDMDLWLKMGKLGKFYNFHEFFACFLEYRHDNHGHISQNHGLSRKLNFNIKLRKKYRSAYPGFTKAYFLCWVSYFYSFLPFRKELWPVISKTRNLILGKSHYRYFKGLD